MTEESERPAADAARARAEWLAAIVEASDDAIYSRTLDGKVLSWNPGAERLLGYSAAEMLGADAMRTVPPERMGEFAEINEKVARGELVELPDTTRLRKGGAVVEVSIRIAPIRDAAGAVVAASGVMRDIGAQKRAQAQLRRLAAIVEASRDAIWSWTPDGVITSWNAEAERLFGYAAAEAVGRSLLMLVPLERRGLAAQAIERLRRGGAIQQYETVRLRKDGARIDVDLTVSPMRNEDGEVVGAATICRDISQRKAAETELLRREELLRLSQDAGRVGSFEWDVQRATTRYSPEYARIYGEEPGALVGGHEAWLARIHPDDRARVQAYQRDAFARGETDHRCEFRIVRPDGDVRWVEARSRALFGGGGEPVRVIGVNVDITERKQVEERQALLLREFDHRVKNILANVKALLLQSKLTSSPERFVEAFEGRLDTFARTHEALLGGNFAGAALRLLAELELSPYLRSGGGNVELDGPDLTLAANAAQIVSLALHELATNAAKYGALSDQGGRVHLSWRLAGKADAGRVHLAWRESSGPRVRAPRRRGLGRMLLERSVPAGLTGEARLEFAREGVRYELEFPARANLMVAGRVAA